MLFDLRGRGRRGVVRVIYGALAVLFGSGLVLFGVGGFGGTGILSSLSGNEGAGSGPNYSSQIGKYRKQIKKNPKDAVAWENLAKTLYHEAGVEPNTTSAGVVTSSGKAVFREDSEAWEGYIALNPPKPNVELAQLMGNVYSVGGLDKPGKEVEVLQLAVAARPTDAALYAELAEYAYLAKNTSIGDLASAKAVALAPADQRKRLKTELAEIKAHPNGEKEKVYTTTTDGKTFTGKETSEGKIEAHEVKTTPTTTTGKTGTSTTKK